MSRPPVIAYHLVWTAYGTWLPNDPRGSGSHVVHSDVLAELGDLHLGRKRIQPCGREIRDFYDRASPLLVHPVELFRQDERHEIAIAFSEVIRRENLTCYACAIMPDHVHILIRKHRLRAEKMMELLKDSSRERLRSNGFRLSGHPVWTGGHGWIVFLDHPDDIRRTIPYIENNPLPIGLPLQPWPFIREYDGWPQPV